MGGVVNTTKKAFSDTVGQAKTLVTHPSKLNIGQMANLSTGGGLSPLQQAYKTFSGGDPAKPNDPFTLDPAQSAADQSAITTLGQKQYDETVGELPKVVNNAVMQQLPGMEEKLNSQHLLNSTELPHQIAQQQEYLTQNLAVPAMAQLHGMQSGALQRGLSLEDFANQAQVAKSLGATVAPTVGNGKGGAIAGMGSGATAGTAIMPGWGTAIGGALGAGAGYLAGGGANRGGSGKSG